MTRKNAKAYLERQRYLPSRVDRALADARANGQASIGSHVVTWSFSTGFQVKVK